MDFFDKLNIFCTYWFYKLLFHFF